MLRRTYNLLFYANTDLLRFWFAFASMGQGLMFFFNTDFSHQYSVLQHFASQEVWAMLFVINSFALIYGTLSKRCSYPLLIVEGVLGVAIWTLTVLSHIIIFGYPNATIACLLIALHLFVRYPTPHNPTLDRRVPYDRRVNKR